MVLGPSLSNDGCGRKCVSRYWLTMLACLVIFQLSSSRGRDDVSEIPDMSNRGYSARDMKIHPFFPSCRRLPWETMLSPAVCACSPCRTGLNGERTVKSSTIWSSTMTATFIPTQEFETMQLIFDLATGNANQRDFALHICRFAFSIMMTSTFGKRVGSWQHEDVQAAAVSSRIISKITHAGFFIVDELLFLAKLPIWLQPQRKEAEAYGKPLAGLEDATLTTLAVRDGGGQGPPYATAARSSKTTTCGGNRGSSTTISPGSPRA